MASAEPGIRYALVLGSNHRRARHLRLACRRLAEQFAVEAATPALRTRDGVARYLNAAVAIHTHLSLAELRTAVRAIEDATGRKRGVARVTLDIDIVVSCDADGTIMVHKPEDLRRDYVQRLLRQIGFVSAVTPACR